MKSLISYCLIAAGALAAIAMPVGANPAAWPKVSGNDCSASNFHDNDLATYAELKEQRLPAASMYSINPGTNGSIRVHGWNQADVLVKACVQTAADTESEARALVPQVTIARGAGQIEPDGPSTNEHQYWSISYEIWLPNASNLDMKAHNGSIHIETVHGDIHFDTVNGSVHLSDIGGDVHGSTVNGSLSIDLTGNAWNGSGLTAQTTNGSVNLVLPEHYSAQLEASTVNGRVRVDFPVTMSGEIGKTMSFQLGNGGPAIRATTVNGSVHIGRGA